jgi:hypothetical protein
MRQILHSLLINLTELPGPLLSHTLLLGLLLSHKPIQILNRQLQSHPLLFPLLQILTARLQKRPNLGIPHILLSNNP